MDREAIKTNPLFAVAKAKYSNRLNEIDFLFLDNRPDNINTYTLGFCDGVAHYASVTQKIIEGLQQKVKELQNIK